jgi:PEGA domain-containing protein
MRRKLLTLVALFAVIALSVLYPEPASAQRRGGGRGPVFVGGYFYDPFFGPYPWWGPAAFPYPYYPIYDDRAQVRLSVTPKEAAVYVDGYYAGIVDDFDGVLQSLPLPPGGHDLAIYLEGYQTVHQRLYLTPRKSFRVRYTMKNLGAGETSEPPSIAPPVPPPPPGSAMVPRTAPPGSQPPGFAPVPPRGATTSGFGTIALRVQPGDAEILIDGERWNQSAPGERLLVQVDVGSHHVEIRKPGYRNYVNDVTIQPDETLPLNVSLSSQ